MKTITLAIAAAGVASAVAEDSKTSQWTKEELQESTLTFIRENEGRIKFVGNRNLRKVKSSRSDNWQRELGGSKGGKNPGGWSGSSGSGWSGSGSGSGSGWSRSGKAGKGTRTWNGGHKEETFFILPTSCPGECITSDVDDDYQFKDAVKSCKDEDSEKWSVLSDGSYVMIESYDMPHWCISVDYKDGDDEEKFEEVCMGEYYLALKECGSYGTQWYFTGGQLVSSLCWAGGLSTYMGVFLDDEKCDGSVTVFGESPEEPILRADTFMFVNHLPKSPIELEDVYG